MGNHRLLSLAAGVVQEFPPERAVYAAHAAGFNAVGIWCDSTTWSAASTRAVRTALHDTGLVALDLEVLWMHPGERVDQHDAMLDYALELDARNVLCVSSEPQALHTMRRFEHLCRRAEQGDLRVALEFLSLTEIRTLQQALAVVEGVGHPAGAVLVDALHLTRCGGVADDVRAMNPQWLTYLQLCDASREPLDSSFEGLLEDALHLRRLPGDGDLPLRDLLDTVDAELPLSLEVRSRALNARFAEDIDGRAAAVYRATQRFLQTTP
ncbi:MAG: sugar phosphate isomerase/epimerase [Halioglobus sp.]|nr:sugar phosphate isomerase/epimerase [Halioglobus sp.]